MRRPLIITLVVVVLLGGLGFGGWRAYQYLYERLAPEQCEVLVPGQDPTPLSQEQARNASIIVAASVERKLPEQAAVVAIATAYQESALRNLEYGDRDSLGLFQQRPSFGWGTEEQIMDPWYASNRFYEEIVKFDDWQNTDVNDLAQKAQRSGHPEAYRKHETKARAVAAALRGSAPASLSCLSFKEAPTARPDAFQRVLATFGTGITQDTQGNTLTITSADPTILWAAAQQVVANSYDGGVTNVVVGNQEWNHTKQGWHQATTPAAEGTAVVTLGKAS